MKVYLDNGAYMPTKAHTYDAGYDLKSRDYKIIPPRGSATFDTGVHIKLPVGTVGFLKSKSGLNVKHGLLSTGVIDSGYTGSIVVKLYNMGDIEYVVNIGDKITQLVILPICMFELDETNNLEDLKNGDRLNDGFGSSGK